MIHRNLSLVALSLILSTVCVQAATYRVDNLRGDDAADGVQAPLKTIACALPRLKPGDALLLTNNPEPYRESIPLHTHGTAAAQIIIDGGGATITGGDPAPKDGWVNQDGLFKRPQALEVKFLFGPDTRYEQGKSEIDLKPLEWFWKTGELSFRPAEGKTPADYDLQMSVRVSGVMTNGAGQIIVRNLTAKHFYNDGFNLHSGSGPLWFENIRGLWNGDEGFSAHENAECHVRGGEFSNNYWHGIADVGLARTYYQNIICRDNRTKGILLIGGMHTITDAEISGSPEQIVLTVSDLKRFPRLDKHPLRTSITHLRNVRVQSSEAETGVVVNADATGVLEHCLLLGGKFCLQVEAEGRAHVSNSILSGAVTAEVSAAGEYYADHNLYFPGRLLIGAIMYGADQIEAYRAATGNDARSLWQEPRFIKGTYVSSYSGPAANAAFEPYSYGGTDIGLELRGPRPVEELPAVLQYDFETTNPWSLVYPEPVKNGAGTAVLASAELSTEQAHSGERSCKLSAQLPAGPPAMYNLKLFSQKLPYARPLKIWRFWLYGDGSGRSYGMRIRDGRSESFYRTPGKIDWTGWKQVVWDLSQEPPANIMGGDGNKHQDGPPMELVLDIKAEAGKTCVLYFDDLEVELEK
ncbi:MAG: hypothetical protein ACYC63_08560 [Armatimonadota bacterium]